MNHITLQKVDESNFLACFSLKLETQVCRAGQVVGYLMVIYDYDEEAYFIWHLMIDAQHQGRGCGRAAMEAALAYIRSKPFGASNLVRLTVSPENAAACHLYQTLRFSPTGRADGDEIELERVLD